MNLIQIQEDLKGLPTQAIMAYANGQNPQVPPYVALAELNRRKQLEQSIQKQEAPQQEGTVKDRITQDVGLMHLQNQRQQQAMQSIAKGAAQLSSANPVPGMAHGGIVALAEGGETRQDLLDQMTEEELQAYRIAKLKERLGIGTMLPRGETVRSADVMERAAYDRGKMEGPLLPLPGERMAQPARPAAPAATPAATPAASGLAGISIPSEGPGGLPGLNLQGITNRADAERLLSRLPAEDRAGAMAALSKQFPQAAQPTPRAAPSAFQAPTPAPQPAPSAGLPAALPQSQGVIPVPQVPSLSDMVKEQQALAAPEAEKVDTARQGLAALLREQQAEREAGNADAQLRALLGGFQGDGDPWRAMQNSARAWGATAAEQQRIKEQINVELKQAELADAQGAEKNKQEHIKNAMTLQGKLRESMISAYSQEQQTAAYRENTRLDYEAELRRIDATLQAARDKGASRDEEIKILAEERKTVHDELTKLTADEKDPTKAFSAEGRAEIKAKRQQLELRARALQEALVAKSPTLQSAYAGIGGLSPTATPGNKVINFSDIK